MDEPNGKDTVRRIALGADHSSFRQKETLKAYLESLGYRVSDVGCFDEGKVDYPDIAYAAAKKVANGECERAIVMDGAGIGSCIACNKVRGIRAATCWDLRTIVNSREHNDANVLSLGAPALKIEELCAMAKTWLETRFAGGRHLARINKISAIERGGRPS
jgi:ribose 5-phosphate isomerase B